MAKTNTHIIITHLLTHIHTDFRKKLIIFLLSILLILFLFLLVATHNDKICKVYVYIYLYAVFIYMYLCLYIFIIIIPTNSFPSFFLYYCVCCLGEKKRMCSPHRRSVSEEKLYCVLLLQH